MTVRGVMELAAIDEDITGLAGTDNRAIVAGRCALSSGKWHRVLTAILNIATRS